MVAVVYAHAHVDVNGPCAPLFADMRLGEYGDGMTSAVAAKIAKLRRSLGKTQAEFGSVFGVGQAAVSRWEKGSMPEPQHLAKIAELLGETVASLIGLGGQVAIPAGEMVEVRGSVAAGVWREAWEWDPDERFHFSAGRSLPFTSPDRFGLRVDGDSMDLLYPAGTLLDCVSLIALDEVPVPGRRYIVLRECDDGTFEATVKEYAVGGDGKGWLIPRSSKPEHQAPIPAHDGDGRIVETRILARVMGSYRPE